jgi:hypothetical protein
MRNPIRSFMLRRFRRFEVMFLPALPLLALWAALSPNLFPWRAPKERAYSAVPIEHVMVLKDLVPLIFVAGLSLVLIGQMSARGTSELRFLLSRPIQRREHWVIETAKLAAVLFAGSLASGAPSLNRLWSSHERFEVSGLYFLRDAERVGAMLVLPSGVRERLDAFKATFDSHPPYGAGSAGDPVGIVDVHGFVALTLACVLFASILMAATTTGLRAWAAHTPEALLRTGAVLYLLPIAAFAAFVVVEVLRTNWTGVATPATMEIAS